MLGDVFVQGVEDLKNVTVDFEIKMTEREFVDKYSIDMNEEGIVFKVGPKPRHAHLVPILTGCRRIELLSEAFVAVLKYGQQFQSHFKIQDSRGFPCAPKD